jgi:hypothetical protein
MSKSPIQAASRRRRKFEPCWQRTPASLMIGRTKDNEGAKEDDSTSLLPATEWQGLRQELATLASLVIAEA